MANTIDILRNLVHKEDAAYWAAVNGYSYREDGDFVYIGDYLLTFSSIDGRLVCVDREVPEGTAL